MKVVLRNLETGLYFQGPGQWITSADTAFDFVHTAEAIAHACKHNLRNIEIVLLFEDPAHDIRIPLFTGELPDLLTPSPHSRRPGLR